MHIWSTSTAQMRIAFVDPLSTMVHERRAIENRPDWQGGASVALGDSFVVFSDIRHDRESGGSSRLLVDRFDELEPAATRRRAVRR